MSFQSLTSSFTPTIFTWSFYCDFIKVEKNAFEIKIQLSLLNSLIGESDIDKKFLSLLHEYPKIKRVLPLLIAVRKPPTFVVDGITEKVVQVEHLFKVREKLTSQDDLLMLDFFHASWLRNIFLEKKISNLIDYVFGVEAGLDSNGRKNRSGKTMEILVKVFVDDFCKQHWYHYKEQATVTWIKANWGIEIKSEKSQRKFDFAIFNWDKTFLLETNFYGGGGSKLKSVWKEFSWLYEDMKQQDIKFFWITDGSIGWNTALKPLEDAYIRMEWNIYNISMLRDGILNDLIK